MTESKPVKLRPASRVGPIDKLIGERLRKSREEHGYSQETLAEIIGVTPASVAAFELGLTRIGAGQLFEISQALLTPISFFFGSSDPE